MGSRSRRRERTAPADGALSRTETRNVEARASLQPLAAGERPRAVVVAAALAALLGVANLAFLATGWEVRGEAPAPAGVVGFSALMLVAAFYMWQLKYWAVLGFQCLLALSAIIAGLSLMVASNVQAAILCLAILGGSGTLFYFLVRALARIQMPERPARRTR